MLLLVRWKHGREHQDCIDADQSVLSLSMHSGTVRKSAWEAGMEQTAMSDVYICPMHPDVRQANPGKCPRCGMSLLPAGTRFAMLRHMMSNPTHMIIMAALMVGVMAAAMMMMR
jgi:hypothetical protein